MHVADPTAAQAQLDLTTAYIYTAGLRELRFCLET